MTNFSTSNFHLASCLMVQGQTPTRIDKSEPRSIKIMFEDSTGLRDLVEQYWNGTLEIVALHHNQQYKTLMERIND